MDGLRGIAILLVLCAHCHRTSNFPLQGIWHEILGLGRVGVDFFFLISGFLITTLLLREVDRTGTLNVHAFHMRRLLRIIPAYAAFLLAVAVLQFAGHAGLHYWDWITALTYTVNFYASRSWEIGHIWALSIEEHFYLLWPILICLVGARHVGRLAVCGIALCFLLRWLLLLGDVAFSAKWTFVRIDPIAVGCLFAWLARDARWRDRLDRACLHPLAAPFLLATLVSSLALRWVSWTLMLGLGISIASVCLGLLLWAAVRCPEHWVGRMIGNRCLVGLGAISYSLYLWQQLFLYPASPSFLRTFPQNLLFALLAACLSYYLVERPFLAMKVRYAASS